MITKTVTVILLAVVGANFDGFQRTTPTPTRTEGPVSQLWSPDDTVRNSAKAAILKAGPAASEPLMSLLKDMLDDRFEPHYATGKEVEGAQFWAYPSGHRAEARFEITWRLILDCVDMLADMECVEAVPLIIRAMNEEFVLNLGEHYTPQIYALIKIGPPAVPALIDTIKNAYAIAEAIAGNGASTDAPDFADRIRLRSAMALGGIGDARALPILEEISKPGGSFEDKSLGLAVEYYINQIRKKQHMPTR